MSLERKQQVLRTLTSLKKKNNVEIGQLLQWIRDGQGERLKKLDLKKITSIFPTEQEAGLFHERLYCKGLESFEQLDNIRQPYVIGKTSKADQFFIAIIKEINIIEKANLLL